MNAMLDGIGDNKNIGLLKNLWWLRQALDVYCLISANATGISRRGGGKNFFVFLRRACVHLIALDICKIFEKERFKREKVKYELNSIDGVLRSFDSDKTNVLDTVMIDRFVLKYGPGQDEHGTLSPPDNNIEKLSNAVNNFKKKYHTELERFKTFRDKGAAHSEFLFTQEDLPSYDIMERLFSFGMDFYMLVSEAFIGVGPLNLDADRRVKASLKGVLKALGIDEIKTEME